MSKRKAEKQHLSAGETQKKKLERELGDEKKDEKATIMDKINREKKSTRNKYEKLNTSDERGKVENRKGEERAGKQ